MDIFQECQILQETYPFIPSSYDDASNENYLFYVTSPAEKFHIITAINSMVYTSGGRISTETLKDHIKRAELYFQEIYGFKISEYTSYFRSSEYFDEFFYKLNLAFKHKWKIEKRSNPGILGFSKNEYHLSFHRSENCAKMRVSHIKSIPYPLIGDHPLSEMESVLIKIRQSRLLEKKLQLEKSLEEVNKELASIG